MGCRVFIICYKPFVMGFVVEFGERRAIVSWVRDLERDLVCR